MPSPPKSPETKPISSIEQKNIILFLLSQKPLGAKTKGERGNFFSRIKDIYKNFGFYWKTWKRMKQLAAQPTPAISEAKKEKIKSRWSEPG